jgi:DNA ligase D-like protein (predicted 3'-phosphoesterase)
MSLAEYRRKRQFSATPEPEPPPQAAKPRLKALRTPDRRRFCVQQHAASHLHYDLRLEMGGVLKSWAIPKGPTLDPDVKRLAMQTEDHPLDYLRFEGEIPAGSYGAGTVVVWDIGEYEIVGHQPPMRQWERGGIKFILHGQRLRGEFALAQMHGRNAKDNAWLLIKKHDDFARSGDRAEQHKGSVISGMTLTSADPPTAATGPVARRANPARGSGEFPSAPAARGRQTRHAPAPAAARPAATPKRGARPSRTVARARRPAPAANAAKAVRAPGGVRRRKPAATSRRASADAPRAAHGRRAKTPPPQPPSALRAALPTGSAARRAPQAIAGAAPFARGAKRAGKGREIPPRRRRAGNRCGPPPASDAARPPKPGSPTRSGARWGGATRRLGWGGLGSPAQPARKRDARRSRAGARAEQ